MKKAERKLCEQLEQKPLSLYPSSNNKEDERKKKESEEMLFLVLGRSISRRTTEKTIGRWKRKERSTLNHPYAIVNHLSGEVDLPTAPLKFV